MDHSSPIYEESKGIPVLHQQVLYVGNLTPTADGYESTTGYDAGAPLPERQPVNVTVHPDRRAEAKTGDFPNERLHPSKLAADVVAILMPLALLGFMVAISRLEGGEVDRATFSAWENAVTVVSLRPSSPLFLHRQALADQLSLVCDYVPDSLRLNHRATCI